MPPQGDDFREKRDDVLRVCYRTPALEHVICLDEKAGTQAIERAHPDLPMGPGRPMRRESWGQKPAQTSGGRHSSVGRIGRPKPADAPAARRPVKL